MSYFLKPARGTNWCFTQNNPRLICAFILFSLLSVGQLLAQKSVLSTPKCGCDELKLSSRGYFGSEKEAEELVNSLLMKVTQVSKLNFGENIQVKEANCGSPMALICDTDLPNGKTKNVRVILYNNYFLNRITKNKGPATWVDKHILAHEIGHHVFGDPVNAESIAILAQMAENDGVVKNVPKSKLENLQAEEIRADFFGLWLLYKTEPSFDFTALIENFDEKFWRQFDQNEKKDRKGQATGTHPLFEERLEAMKKFWSKLKRDNRRRLLVGRGYFSDAATAAYIDLRPERAYWDVSLGAGLTVFGLPTFRSNNEQVSGFLYALPDAWNTNLNLLVSRFNWQKAWRFEAEMGWARQKYGTTNESNNGKRLVEELQMSFLTLGPRLTWNQTNGQSRLFTGKIGLFASIGANLRYPLAQEYVNYAVPSAQLAANSLSISVSPRVAVGVEYLKKTLLPRGFKVALGYEPQWLGFKTNPSAQIMTHNFDCTLYYSILRK